MANLELVGMAIAQAIAQSKKFGATEHAAAMKFIVENAEPGDMADAMCRIGNISAVRQELEKHGLVVKAEATPSALVINVKDALARIAKLGQS